MRPDRIFTTIVVAVLVAMAGFTGAVTAAAPAGDTVSQQQAAEDVQSVTISEMMVENLSTEMELESAEMTVETMDGTEEVTVDSAMVTLEEATVEVTNATLEDGTISLESANVTITDGQVEIQSSHGDRSMDLSDTDESVEEVTFELDEVAGEDVQMTEGMSEATISQMTVEGISGEGEIGVLVANMQVEGERETENVSVSVQNGNYSVENATVELQDATLEDGTLTAGSVQASVDSAEVSAERIVVLRGLDLDEHENVQRSVQDAQFSQENVEVDVEEWSSMLEELVGSQTAAEGES